MDTSNDTQVDKLGRRTGPRRKYSLTEKLQILEATRKPGASVADVARAHGVNANVVFGGRHLAKKGLLRAPSPESATLLPIKVGVPTVLAGPKAHTLGTEAPKASIEVEFPGGIRVRVHGSVDIVVLKRVFDALGRR